MRIGRVQHGEAKLAKRRSAKSSEARQSKAMKDHGDYGTSGTGTLWSVSQSHTNDPQPSHDAEKRMRRSGALHTQKERVLQLVELYPGRTAAELLKYTSMKEIAVRKRLSDLKNDGKVIQGGPRTCRVAGTSAMVWRLAEPANEGR